MTTMPRKPETCAISIGIDQGAVLFVHEVGIFHAISYC